MTVTLPSLDEQNSTSVAHSYNPFGWTRFAWLQGMR